MQGKSAKAPMDGSDAADRFRAALRHILTVPKKEIDAKVAASHHPRQKKGRGKK